MSEVTEGYIVGRLQIMVHMLNIIGSLIPNPEQQATIGRASASVQSVIDEISLGFDESGIKPEQREARRLPQPEPIPMFEPLDGEVYTGEVGRKRLKLLAPKPEEEGDET